MLNSPTHCQVAPAEIQAKTWQRVCLPYRTTKTTEKQTDEKRTPNAQQRVCGNSGCSGKSKVCASKKLCAKRTGKCF